MIALPIILVIITLIGVKFSGFHKDYAGLSQTTAVKGFFAVVIVMSHMMGFSAEKSRLNGGQVVEIQSLK